MNAKISYPRVFGEKAVARELPDFVASLSSGHPVRVYFEENLFLKDLLEQLQALNLERDLSAAFNLFHQIAQVEVRYVRKENQLFPFLERHGWEGPSRGMWMFQDENRKLIKNARHAFESKDVAAIRHCLDVLQEGLRGMIEVEEYRLLPIALNLLRDEDWEEMRKGESEIGWMHQRSVESSVGREAPCLDVSVDSPDRLKMMEGVMSLEQVNLMLQAIPFDLTYVDEHDRVIFYNRGEDRVFPRSSGVIGREVRFCHPPKSVKTVLEILEEFRTGRQDMAEFWIAHRGKLVHIRYFAVRDAERRYRGVIEVSQDVTEIKKLEGERRLLQWER